MVLKKAKKLRRRLNGDITLTNVKKYIENKGFSVLYFNTSDGDSEIARYDLKQYAAEKLAFTYISTVKLIFIDSRCSEETKLYLLLHEIGHVEINMEINTYDIESVKFELQADAFANEVITGEYSKKCSLLFSISLLSAVFAIVSCIYAILYFNSGFENSINKSQKTAYLANNDVENISNVWNEEVPDNKTVYILPTGKKYHKSDCRFVNDNAIAVPYNDIPDNYTPCKVCKP